MVIKLAIAVFLFLLAINLIANLSSIRIKNFPFGDIVLMVLVSFSLLFFGARWLPYTCAFVDNVHAGIMDTKNSFEGTIRFVTTGKRNVEEIYQQASILKNI